MGGPDELTEQAATFAPRCLPALLDRLRREGVLAVPLELEGF